MINQILGMERELGHIFLEDIKLAVGKTKISKADLDIVLSQLMDNPIPYKVKGWGVAYARSTRDMYDKLQIEPREAYKCLLMEMPYREFIISLKLDFQAEITILSGEDFEAENNLMPEELAEWISFRRFTTKEDIERKVSNLIVKYRSTIVSPENVNKEEIVEKALRLAEILRVNGKHTLESLGAVGTDYNCLIEGLREQGATLEELEEVLGKDFPNLRGDVLFGELPF